MNTISSRRVFIVVVLLVAAIVGALLRSFSAAHSTPYYLGTLLMVMWVPIVGTIISFLLGKLRPIEPGPPSFSAAMPFVPQVAVVLNLHSERALDLLSTEQDGKVHCLFIAGTEGFSVRLSLLDGQTDMRHQKAEVQFLVPAAALPKFPIGSTFQLMQGKSGMGTGEVLCYQNQETPA